MAISTVANVGAPEVIWAISAAPGELVSAALRLAMRRTTSVAEDNQYYHRRRNTVPAIAQTAAETDLAAWLPCGSSLSQRGNSTGENLNYPNKYRTNVWQLYELEISQPALQTAAIRC